MSLKGRDKKWKNHSCEICSKTRTFCAMQKIEKFAAKYDRLVQELCAVESDMDGWGRGENYWPVRRLQSVSVSPSLPWTRHQSCKTRTRGFPEIEKVLKKTKKMLTVLLT